MRIAVNTRFLLPTKMEGFGWFTYEVVKRMVEQHPEHTFLFFFDRPFDKRFIFGENVVPVVLSPPARHPILFYLWFEIAVKKALKKYQADVFFSPDGYLSLGSSVPQIPVIHDLNFEHYPLDIPWSARVYLRHFFPKFAQKAAQIITVSEYSKQDIVQTYGISESLIQVAWNGASEAFVPLTEEEITQVKQRYSNAKEYFLFVGALHPRKNLARLLQAFRKYKLAGGKLDLVIVGSLMWKQFPVEIESELQSSVHITGHLALEELTKVMGAAYCLAFVPYFEGFGIPLVEAMRAEVPLIAGNKTSLPEVAAEAAFYVDPMDVDSIANALYQLETNESLRQQLIEAGRKRKDLFSWDFTAQKVWETIEEVFQKR